jgi:hypothetical protein
VIFHEYSGFTGCSWQTSDRQHLILRSIFFIAPGRPVPTDGET